MPDVRFTCPACGYSWEPREATLGNPRCRCPDCRCRLAIKVTQGVFAPAYSLDEVEPDTYLCSECRHRWAVGEEEDRVGSPRVRCPVCDEKLWVGGPPRRGKTPSRPTAHRCEPAGGPDWAQAPGEAQAQSAGCAPAAALLLAAGTLLVAAQFCLA